MRLVFFLNGMMCHIVSVVKMLSILSNVSRFDGLIKYSPF